ncbi:MAG: hypothetical protein ACI4KD_08280 [Oscillospiraceae bacterium]
MPNDRIMADLDGLNRISANLQKISGNLTTIKNEFVRLDNSVEDVWGVKAKNVFLENCKSVNAEIDSLNRKMNTAKSIVDTAVTKYCEGNNITLKQVQKLSTKKMFG